MDVSTVWAMLQSAIGQASPEGATQGLALTGEDLRTMVGCISAAFVMGLGAFGPGAAEGFAAAKACEGIARNPEAAPQITRTMIIGQAVAESTCIYTLVIAALILFVVI